MLARASERVGASCSTMICASLPFLFKGLARSLLDPYDNVAIPLYVVHGCIVA